MVLEGMVPVLIHTPPTMERASTTTTRLPNLAAATAARCPAGPEPITTMSYCCALMPISPRLNAVRGLAAAYYRDGSRLGHRFACLSRITVHGDRIREMKTSVFILEKNKECFAAVFWRTGNPSELFLCSPGRQYAAAFARFLRQSICLRPVATPA